MCFIAGAFEAGMGVNTLHYQKLISDFTVILNFIEEHPSLILQALLCYKSNQVMQVNDRIALKFADAMLD